MEGQKRLPGEEELEAKLSPRRKSKSGAVTEAVADAVADGIPARRQVEAWSGLISAYQCQTVIPHPSLFTPPCLPRHFTRYVNSPISEKREKKNHERIQI